jgi:hypothetical protein
LSLIIKLITRPRGLSNRTAPCHRQMTRGPHAYKKSSSKNSSSSEQQSIAAIYRKFGKCEYIKYFTTVGNKWHPSL